METVASTGAAQAPTNDGGGDDEQRLRAYGLVGFRDFCAKKSPASPSLRELDKPLLAALAGEFLEQTRSRQGTLYGARALRRFQIGLNNYLRTVFGADFDLARDPAFSDVNGFLATAYGKAALPRPPAVVKLCPVASNGQSADAVIIGAEDLTKIGQYFWKVINTPRGLQQKVWFDLMIHLGSEGIENQHSMRKDSFVILKSQSDGRRRLQWKVDGQSRGAPVFDDPENPLCPVKTFQLYLTKLNVSCPSLFQRPHDGITKASRFWFHMFPLNNTMLALMMYDISKDAGLSRVYPNFCTQVLPEKGRFYQLARRGYLSLENFCSQPVKPLLPEGPKEVGGANDGGGTKEGGGAKEGPDRPVLEPIAPSKALNHADKGEEPGGTGAEEPAATPSAGGPVPFKLCAQCLTPVKAGNAQKHKGILCSVPCLEAFMKAKEMRQNIRVSFKDGTRVPQYTLSSHVGTVAPGTVVGTVTHGTQAKIIVRPALPALVKRQPSKEELQLLGKNIPDDVYSFIQQVARIQALGHPVREGVPTVFKQDGSNVDAKAWSLPAELLQLAMNIGKRPLGGTPAGKQTAVAANSVLQRNIKRVKIEPTLKINHVGMQPVALQHRPMVVQRSQLLAGGKKVVLVQRPCSALKTAVQIKTEPGVDVPEASKATTTMHNAIVRIKKEETPLREKLENHGRLPRCKVEVVHSAQDRKGLQARPRQTIVTVRAPVRTVHTRVVGKSEVALTPALLATPQTKSEVGPSVEETKQRLETKAESGTSPETSVPTSNQQTTILQRTVQSKRVIKASEKHKVESEAKARCKISLVPQNKVEPSMTTPGQHTVSESAQPMQQDCKRFLGAQMVMQKQEPMQVQQDTPSFQQQTAQQQPVEQQAVQQQKAMQQQAARKGVKQQAVQQHTAHQHVMHHHTAHQHAAHQHMVHQHAVHHHEVHQHEIHQHEAHQHATHQHEAHQHAAHQHEVHQHAAHQHSVHQHAGLHAQQQSAQQKAVQQHGMQHHATQQQPMEHQTVQQATQQLAVQQQAAQQQAAQQQAAQQQAAQQQAAQQQAAQQQAAQQQATKQQATQQQAAKQQAARQQAMQQQLPQQQVTQQQVMQPAQHHQSVREQHQQPLEVHKPMSFQPQVPQHHQLELAKHPQFQQPLPPHLQPFYQLPLSHTLQANKEDMLRCSQESFVKQPQQQQALQHSSVHSIHKHQQAGHKSMSVDDQCSPSEPDPTHRPLLAGPDLVGKLEIPNGM
ncbi:uncharacterized protein ISCGN_024190 [Ixodes scapularis]